LYVISRRIKAILVSPSGSGNSAGVTTYNCNFQGSEVLKPSERRRYKAGLTRYGVIFEVFDRLEVLSFSINFESMTRTLSIDTEIQQNETDFRFLHRLANEWRCIFFIGTDTIGRKAAIFCDYKFAGGLGFEKLITGALIGSSVLLDYRKGVGNVRSYKWRHNIGESGTGDSVRIVIQNNKPVLFKSIATTDKVITYRFVPERLKDFLKRKKVLGDTVGLSQAYAKIMSANTFAQVEKYFVEEYQTTAPQGKGFSLDNVELIGNPAIIPIMNLVLGNGFPDILVRKDRSIKFYVSKVEHSIDKNGYVTVLDAADVYTTFGIR
jgi:hypothetical protein